MFVLSFYVLFYYVDVKWKQVNIVMKKDSKIKI